MDLIVFEDMRCIHELFHKKLDCIQSGGFGYRFVQKQVGLRGICNLLFILRRYGGMIFEEKLLSARWRMGVLSAPAGGK